MREDFNYETFAEQIELDENNLAAQMANIPSLLAYYGHQAAQWQAVLDNIDLQAENLAAEIRRELKASGVKMTVADIEAEIMLNKEYGQFKRMELKAKVERDDYKRAVDAIDKKGNMASSIGAMKRSEMSNLHTPLVYGSAGADYTTFRSGAASIGAVGPTGPVGMPGKDGISREEILAMLDKASKKAS